MSAIRRGNALLAALLGSAAAASAQPPTTTIVVPAAYATQEAPGVAFWALSPFAAHRQLLIGPSHLTSATQQGLQALELRRNTGDNRPLSAGQLQLRVSLSHSPRPADDPSDVFADNRGNDEVTVFAGVVALPASQGSPTSPAPWLSPHSVRIPFRRPFPYLGGVLCIDTETTLQPGVPSAPWWPVDAVSERGGGSATTFGTTCLPGTAGADPASFVPGSTGVFYLRGALAAGSIGFCMVGNNVPGGVPPVPFDLGPLGAPGCWLNVAPVFVAPTVATELEGSGFLLANWRMRVPLAPFLVGSTFCSQWAWVDGAANPMGLTFSEGVRVSLGGLPVLTDVGWVESPTLNATRGEVLRGRMPVIRFHM